MLVRVLGPIGVLVDGREVSIASRNQRIVLGMLAADPGKLVGADALIDAIWPDEPPASARASLRTYVSRLRGLVGEAVVGEAGGYRLEAEVDAERFTGWLSDTAALPPGDALELLDTALGLWRGAPFGAEDIDRLTGRATALEESYNTALELRARCLCELGRFVEAIASAETILAEHPFRESIWAVLVSSLASTDRKVEALRAAQTARSALADAGLEPGEQLLAAERMAFEYDVASPTGRPVPIPVGSLIGRDEDLGALGRLLVEHRLISLVGPGGVGKTRLAAEVVHRARDRHRRGAVVAELARIDTATSVADAFVDAIGLTRRGSAEATLAAAAGLDVLLLIDNCEHLVAEVARIAGLLLAAGQEIRMITTSRTRLAAPGEFVYRVEPLAVAGPDAAGAQLFLERAAATGLPVADDEMSFVARIVARMDGLPLAIEMAAARAFGLGVRGLADEVEEDLSFLRAGHRDPSPRHRTLQATIEWSLSGLGQPTRRCLAEMSVFAGPVPLADVGAVVSVESPADHVLELAERSLVQISHRHGRARYGLLETVREFARNEMAEIGVTEELSRRHAGYVLARSRSAAAQVEGRDEAAGDATLDALFDEIRSALVWSRRHDPQGAVAIMHAILPWARSRQLGEAYEWATWLIDDLGERTDTALLVAYLAHQAADEGSLARADELARRAMALCSDPRVVTAGLDARTDAAIYGGDLATAIGYAEQLFQTASALDDRHAMALGLSSLAMAHEYGGDRQSALLALRRMPAVDSEPPSARGWLLYAHAETIGRDQPGLALEQVEQAIRLADSVDNPFLGGVARVTRLSLLTLTGETGAVATGYADLIGRWQARHDLTHLVTTLRNVAVFLSERRAHGEVVELLAALEAGKLPPSFGVEARALADSQARALAELGRPAYDDCRSRGRRRTPEQAVVRVIEVLRATAGTAQGPTSS